MFRRSKFFRSILFRVSIWYLLLGILSIIAIYYSMEIQMRQNTEKYITEELFRVKENVELYVCQILMLHDGQIDSDGFQRYISDINVQLENAGYHAAEFFDADGGPVGEGGRELPAEENKGKNKSVCVLHYGRNNACDVYYTMPVKGHGEMLGFVRLYLDYHEIYEREWNTFRNMLHGIILIVGVIYVIIWLLLRRMLKPIRSLTIASDRISKHLADGKLDTSLISGQKFYRRRDEIGELAGNYKKMLDVTKEQFDKIEQDKERILSLLDSRQEFYNNITHELKTPLAIISGYAQLIEENGLSDTELFHSGMAQILHESERLHRMVVSLLELQNKEEFSAPEEIVEMAAVLEETVNLMSVKAGKYGNEIVLHTGERDCYVKGRKDRIHQVMINLIDNAIKYGEPKKEIYVIMAEEEGMVRIDVANQGEGLTGQELKRIFEPFFRVDKEKSRELGSAGLGLSIVKKIMDEYGGSIKAESIQGGYTVFTVFFPAFSGEMGDVE